MEKLGEILVKQGVITETQLQSVLQRQKESGGRLGTNLVEMMMLDDASLASLLSQQLGVPSVHPRVLDTIAPDVLASLSFNLVEEYKVVPFKREGQRLHVALLDPSDIAAMDELSQKAGVIIRPYICSESVIHRALSVHYKIQPPVRQTVDDLGKPEGEIIYSKQNLISMDDAGQFTLVDRTDILGNNTKEMFLDATSKTLVIGYFLQYLSYNCDKIAFLAYDQDKNFLWQDAKEFKEGRKGVACGAQVNRSPFWNRYLSRPGFFHTRMDREGADLNWVPRMLDLETVKAFFLAPLSISKKVLGVAIGGSSVSMRLEEELETIKKLHLMAVCALKIQTYRKMIDDL